MMYILAWMMLGAAIVGVFYLYYLVDALEQIGTPRQSVGSRQ